jgi:hypothetical protein
MVIIRNTLTLLCAVICVIGIVGSAKSEETGDLAKRQTFERFVQVSNMRATYNQMLDIMIYQMQMALGTQVKQAAEKAADGAPIDKLWLAMIMDRFVGEYLAKCRTAINNSMPFTELVSGVYYPLYDKVFNEWELQSAIKFFDSSAGHKLAIYTPAILNESVAKINELYRIKLDKISVSISEEALGKLAPELEVLKTKKNSVKSP